MEEDNQKLDSAFGFAMNTPSTEDSGIQEAGDVLAGYDKTEDRWRVIVKYYGDLGSILNGVRGAVYTGLFNNYAIVSVPAGELGRLADAQGIVYVEKPREVYYNVNNGREASCINSVQLNPQTGSGFNTGRAGLMGEGVLVAIIDSGERVIILSS